MNASNVNPALLEVHAGGDTHSGTNYIAELQPTIHKYGNKINRDLLVNCID